MTDDHGDTGGIEDARSAGNTDSVVDAGIAGDVGDAESAGDVGDPGSAGDAGDAGSTVEAGNTGDTGDTGSTGPQPRHVDRPTRRDFARRLGGLAAVSSASAGLAGCLNVDVLDGDDGQGERTAADLPTVEDPPDVVYVPSHREGTEMLGTAVDGPYEFAAMISYAHPFWIVTGDAVEAVDVDDAVDVHLMVAVRDAETGTALPPGGNLTTTVGMDGAVVDERAPWQMLSQQMGLHAGDNVPLDGDGSYEVRVSLPSIGTRTTGNFADRFAEGGSATFSFTYDQALRDALIDRVDYVAEADRGVPGAIEPMGMADALPDAEDLPGTLQGDKSGDDAYRPPRSHDADVPITIVEDFLGDGDPYLLVSPRTPYNSFPLAGMSPAVTVRRDGSEVTDEEQLPATLDDEAGFHYGASVPRIEPGDDATISMEAPSGVARHQGYETAFLEMEPIEVALEAW